MQHADGHLIVDGENRGDLRVIAQDRLDGDRAAFLGEFSVADPARLRLLSLIASRPMKEACVCELTSPLGLSQPTVSHHMKKLVEAGLVEREQ